MTPSTSQTSDSRLSARAPFKPFVFELGAVTAFQVDHPEALCSSPASAVFVSANANPRSLTTKASAQILLGDPAASNRR
jgi:hypothetical protein